MTALPPPSLVTAMSTIEPVVNLLSIFGQITLSKGAKDQKQDVPDEDGIQEMAPTRGTPKVDSNFIVSNLLCDATVEGDVEALTERMRALFNQHKHSVTELSLCNCPRFHAKKMFKLVAHFDNITTFSASDTAFDDECMAILVSRNKKITKLFLQRTHITQTAIESLLSLSQLSTARFEGCPRFTSNEWCELGLNLDSLNQINGRPFTSTLFAHALKEMGQPRKERYIYLSCTPARVGLLRSLQALTLQCVDHNIITLAELQKIATEGRFTITQNSLPLFFPDMISDKMVAERNLSRDDLLDIISKEPLGLISPLVKHLELDLPPHLSKVLMAQTFQILLQPFPNIESVDVGTTFIYLNYAEEQTAILDALAPYSLRRLAIQRIVVTKEWLEQLHDNHPHLQYLDLSGS
ncbi:MAG TPA: hypothetical protein VN457_07865, partial [Chlamydiales bacterium]|nr:hypothetical protein [Chlamydiales bacterium]